LIEHNILKLITKEQKYYNKYLNIISSVSLETENALIFNLIKTYYSKFSEHNYIGQEELASFFRSEYPAHKDPEHILQVIAKVYAMDTSDSLASDMVGRLIEADVANKVINALLPTLQGEQYGLMAKAQELLADWQSTLSEDDEDESPFIDDDLDDLLDHNDTDGLRFRLDCVHEALGNLTGGTLGHVFARPEVGKTTFAHSEASFFAEQIPDDSCILWINNEEEGTKVRLRQYSAVTGMNEESIRRDVESAKRIFAERGGNRLRLYDNASVSITDIEMLCKEHQPRIVWIDQGDKITYRGQDKAGNGADRLKQVYDKLREIVKRCNKQWKMDMVTVGQADAQCEGRKWLNLSNLDSGKTGKAGAFDYCIGIGKTFIDDEEHVRYISFAKNKLGGKHTKHRVILDSEKARYHD
jgi:hypothetical protein